MIESEVLFDELIYALVYGVDQNVPVTLAGAKEPRHEFLKKYSPANFCVEVPDDFVAGPDGSNVRSRKIDDPYPVTLSQSCTVPTT